MDIITHHSYYNKINIFITFSWVTCICISVGWNTHIDCCLLPQKVGGKFTEKGNIFVLLRSLRENF